MSKILARAIITPDGTELQTYSGHDYKEHLDKNGERYMIDGGPSEYGRMSVNKILPEVIIVTTESPFEEIREWFSWGTRGKTGKDPLKYVKLKNLEYEHIKAIIETQNHISDEINGVFKKEIAFRDSIKLKDELVSSKSNKKPKPKL